MLLKSVLCIIFAEASASFVTRNGSQLLVDSKPFRWAGANIYWLGLDENVDGIAFPTKFRVADALQTAVGMGLTVVRSHTLGISTGNALSFESSLGLFNSTALDSADFAISIASQLGLRLVIPLTDNYHYYHGGKHNFCDWLNVPESDFFNNTKVLNAYLAYVSARLRHVNPYTGLAAFEEPAIMAWETGNEFQGAPASWTQTVAAFIKSIDANHLVMDGNYGIESDSLPSKSVDLYSDHFYPVDTARLLTGAVSTGAANKVYVAGEYGWTSGDVLGFLTAAQSCAFVSGTQFWSLFPHLDSYGFEQHTDGFTVHFPGDNALMAGFVDLLTEHAANMSGLPAPVPYRYPDPAQPGITNFTVSSTCKLQTVAWHGASMGAQYNLEQSTASSGPWLSVCTNCGSDNDTPIQVLQQTVALPAWLRVAAVNPNGVMGPWSTPVQASC